MAFSGCPGPQIPPLLGGGGAKEAKNAKKIHLLLVMLLGPHLGVLRFSVCLHGSAPELAWAA